MKVLKQVKHKVGKGSKDSAGALEKRRQDQGPGHHPQPWWKKVILGLIVGASIVVVAAWVVFAVKPGWWVPVKGFIASPQAPHKEKARAQRPPTRVSKTTKTRKTATRPPTTPGSGQGPSTAAQMERPQPLTPEFPTATPTPSTSPITRPQVSIPGGTQVPPAATPSATPSTVTTPSPLLTPRKEESELDEYLEIGTLYAQKGDYEKAEELFQRVTKENPSSAQARNNLGFVYLRQEKYELAEKEFKEAMRINPAFVLPYYNLACLYSRKEMDVEALIYLKRALNRDARAKVWAATDEDFARLRSDVVFQTLVGIPSPQTAESQQKEGVQNQESVHTRKGPPHEDFQEHPQQEVSESSTHVGTPPPTRKVTNR